MGKFRRSWPISSLILVIAIGILFAGISVTNYFQVKAVGKPINHSKNDYSHHSEEKNMTPEMIKRIKENTKDFKQEKERIREQQEKAFAWRNMTENSEVPPKPTANTAAAPPATKEQAAPQQVKNISKTVEPVQNPAQSVNSSGEKIVYLTFDDGPAPISGEIIALLEKYHFKASFFMIDGNIRRYPEAVKLMVKSGEAVGLHSVTHDQKRFYASVNSVLGELNQNRNTLKEISGVDSYLMRTPYGSAPNMKPEYRKAVTEKGYSMWDWNIDSKDWYYKDGRYVNSVIEQLNRLSHHQGPIVILLHEREETLAHLPQLLDYLSKHGYESKAIDDTMTPVQF